MGEAEKAEKLFKRLHERARFPDDVVFGITEIYHERENWERGLYWAGEIGDRALEQRRRADFLRHLGRLEEALEAAEASRDLDPDEPEIYYQFGRIFQVQKKFDEAIAQYDKALNTDSTLLKALYRRSSIKVRLGHL